MSTGTTRSSSRGSFEILSTSDQERNESVAMPTSRKLAPYLQPTKESAQLIVDGKPFLMLAAELHNSSLSSSQYMSTVWQEMKDMNINTLLGSVTWEMIEPVEGRFDFTELDKVILGAREHDMRLVLLWFGSFKNALSTYVPAWVKKDVKRFPRVHILDEDRRSKTIELVSPFSQNAWEADSKAFAALMKHLKQFDEAHSTVIMVQVENETGLLGDSRDRSSIAERAFKQPVPDDLLRYLQTVEELHPIFNKRWPRFQQQSHQSKNKNWEAVFGRGIAAEELFMADAFSRFVAHVAAAGKKEYALPFYANVWLNFDDPSVLDLTGIPLGEGTPTVAGGGAKAGIYPSGGPCPHSMDIWRCHTIAPGHLDFIAPDLYLHDYDWVCSQYRYKNQPLFIPEQKADEAGARRVWLAYGTYGAIGCSPFGIDTLLAKDSPFTRTYDLLHKMRRHILEAHANRPEDIFGFFFDEIDAPVKKHPEVWRKTFSDMEVIIERSFVFGKAGPGYGIIIHQGDGKFLLIGSGFQTTFKSTKSTATFTGILSAYEKEADQDGNLTTLRVMNGDETRSGSFMIMPGEEPDYGGFPIRVTIPARTYVAEVEAYTLEEGSEDV